MRLNVNYLLAACAVFALSGCATQEPVVKVNRVVLAPPDNLLVDCVVAAPPIKSEYLGTVIPAPVPGADSTAQLSYVQALLKQNEERERQLTLLNLHHYENLDACNVRLKRLREWKAQSVEAVAVPAEK